MSIAEQVREVLLGDWFTKMALRYCKKDYGSEERNQYFFYRACYGMNATEALQAVKKFKKAFSCTN